MNQHEESAIGARLSRRTLRSAWIVALVAGLAVGGCYHPEARLDPISPIAGNAIAHNKAVQVVDPWPDHAFRRHQVTDGERVRQAYESYRGDSGGGDGGEDGGGAVSGRDKPASGGDKPGA